MDRLTCRMRNWIVLLLAAATTAATGQMVPNGAHLSVFQRGAFLLSDFFVREELAITEPQKLRINQIFDSISKQQTIALAAAEVDEKQFNAIDQRGAYEILSVLDQAQKGRLSQLTLQRIGIRALADKEVSKSLQIEDSRGQQIGELFKKLDDRLQDIDLAIGDLLKGLKVPEEATKKAEMEKTRAKIIESFDLDRQNIEADRKTATEIAINILDEPERKRWIAALGKPYKFQN